MGSQTSVPSARCSSGKRAEEPPLAPPPSREGVSKQRHRCQVSHPQHKTLFCKSTRGCCGRKLGDNTGDSEHYEELRQLKQARDLTAKERELANSALQVAKDHVASYGKLTNNGAIDLVASNGKTYFQLHRHPKKNDFFTAFEDLDAFKFKRVDDRGIFAFVWGEDPTHTIHLGDAFFAMDASDDMRPDSRPGTILHEVSHFGDVLGTHDVMYGFQDQENKMEQERFMRTQTVEGQDILTQNAESLEYMFEKGFAHSGSWMSAQHCWDCCGEIMRHSLCQKKFGIGGHTGKYHCGHTGACQCYGALYCDCIDSCYYSPHWTCCNASTFHSHCQNWLNGSNVLECIQDIPAGMGAFMMVYDDRSFTANICHHGDQVFAVSGGGPLCWNAARLSLPWEKGQKPHFIEMKAKNIGKDCRCEPQLWNRREAQIWQPVSGVLPKSNVELWYYDPQTMRIEGEELLVVWYTRDDARDGFNLNMGKIKVDRVDQQADGRWEVQYQLQSGSGAMGAGICFKIGGCFKLIGFHVGYNNQRDIKFGTLLDKLQRDELLGLLK